MVSGYMCPVCGYAHLIEAPYTESGGGSYEICPSCGFEYGVTDDDKGETFASWRERWVAGGMVWWSSSNSRKPPGWDPGAQLAALQSRG